MTFRQLIVDYRLATPQTEQDKAIELLRKAQVCIVV